jgi:hypothetical protein
MPSDNSLNHWYGEPVAAFIIHTDVRTSSDLFKDSSNKYGDTYCSLINNFYFFLNFHQSFFTRDGDNPKHLSEGIQKLITYFLNHYSQVTS